MRLLLLLLLLLEMQLLLSSGHAPALSSDRQAGIQLLVMLQLIVILWLRSNIAAVVVPGPQGVRSCHAAGSQTSRQADSCASRCSVVGAQAAESLAPPGSSSPPPER